MKLEKAIELNYESEKSLRSHKFIDHADATKLGIEALKYALADRRGLSDCEIELLPGEE